VLVRCYHGLGDTLQFARYLPCLRELARSVTVWAQPALLPLLRYQPWDITYLPLHDGAPAVAFDVDVEIMELPYLFRSTLETIPSAVPYLNVPDQPRQPPARPSVGLVWRAGDWDGRRSIPFELLVPLFERADIDWSALLPRTLPHEHHPHVRQCGTEEVMATAQRMRSLDLVITVDTMAAHLAGAIGCRVWTLLPEPADWRWLVGRDDSPWYPTMRLFRATEGTWPPVLRRVQAALHGIAAAAPLRTGENAP
jgi:hypothetical protein